MCGDGVLQADHVFCNPDHVSFAMATAGSNGQEAAAKSMSIDAPVHQLQTIMKMLGHDRIDVLKMDIEGAELPVIDSLSKLRPQIAQLLVEFHHRVGVATEVEATRRAIQQLEEMGFRLFHNSDVGKEFSFLRVC